MVLVDQGKLGEAQQVAVQYENDAPTLVAMLTGAVDTVIAGTDFVALNGDTVSIQGVTTDAYIASVSFTPSGGSPVSTQMNLSEFSDFFDYVQQSPHEQLTF